MFEIIKKYKEKKNGIEQSIEGYLLSKNYIIHDIKNNGKSVVYNNNMKTIIVHQNGVVGSVKLGSILFDINGDVLMKLKFIPNSLTMFDVMLKQATKDYELTK